MPDSAQNTQLRAPNPKVKHGTWLGGILGFLFGYGASAWYTPLFAFLVYHHWNITSASTSGTVWFLFALLTWLYFACQMAAFAGATSGKNITKDFHILMDNGFSIVPLGVPIFAVIAFFLIGYVPPTMAWQMMLIGTIPVIIDVALSGIAQRAVRRGTDTNIES